MSEEILSKINLFKLDSANSVHHLFLPQALSFIPDEAEKRLYELEYLVDAQSVGFTTDLIPIFQGVIRKIQKRINPPFGAKKLWIIDSWWWRHVHAERANGPSKCIAFLVPGREDLGFDEISLRYEEIMPGSYNSTSGFLPQPPAVV